MPRLVLILGYIAVTVYAIADAAQHRDSRPYGLPKWLWIAVIIVLPYVGAIAWFVVKMANKNPGPTKAVTEGVVGWSLRKLGGK